MSASWDWASSRDAARANLERLEQQLADALEGNAQAPHPAVMEAARRSVEAAESAHKERRRRASAEVIR
jgi:hypothetical protein